MKYTLYHLTIEDGVLGSTDYASVTMSPHQVTHMSTAGFGFAMDILKCAPEWMDSPMVVIEDENNWHAKILPNSTAFKYCLTSGARWEYAQDTDQQLRCLGLMEPLDS